MAKRKVKVYKPEHFELAIKEFADAMGIVVAAALARTGLQMHDDIVAMTPRDTGLAQSAWRFTVDHIDPSTPPPGEYPPGAAKRGRAQEAAKVTDNSTINISNNLPYILPLEHGHSQQAPHGMVAITSNRYRNYIEANIKSATAKAKL